MDMHGTSDNGNKSAAPGGEANNNPSASGSLCAQVKTVSPRSSMEDLSEYTDADESISSAPTEFLAEFLSALMMKDYENALKYCKLILQYEPHNATAKEFYPLIQEKIKLLEEAQERSSSSRDDSNGNESSDGEEKRSAGSDSEATTASYSSLEDEEVDDNASPSGHSVDANGNSGAAGVAKSIAPDTMPVSLVAAGDMKASAFQSTSSDSESPTEPITQPLTEPPVTPQIASFV